MTTMTTQTPSPTPPRLFLRSHRLGQRYQRKTRDTWEIWTNYGDGWNHECTELSRAALRENVKAYREAVPNILIRVKKRRERITPEIAAEMAAAQGVTRG